MPKDKLIEALKYIKSLGMNAAVSLKPKFAADEAFDFVPYVDMVLIMTVEPGFGGQKFMPAAADKIRQLVALREELGLHYEIEVDGGINNQTAPVCIEAGVDVLVAGSAVFGKEDYKTAIDSLRG
jgi:ribulose-phosphate 3-epimerase